MNGWCFVAVSSLVLYLNIGVPASAQVDAVLLAEIRKTCSGIIEIITNNGTGTVKIKGLDVEVDAGKDTKVYKEGVLLGKIDKVNASEYYSCISSLTTIILGVQKKGALPPDFLGRVKLGDAGRTSIAYVKDMLGTPVSEEEDSAELRVDQFKVELKFLAKSSSEGSKGRILGMRVSLLPASERRGDPSSLIVGGESYYWNPKSCDTDGCEYRINPRARLGASKLREFGYSSSCQTDYVGGVAFNSDYTFFCSNAGVHSNGFTSVSLYLDTSKEDKLVAVARLQNYYQKKIWVDHVKKYPDQKYLLDDWKLQYDILPEDVIEQFETDAGIKLGSFEEKLAQVEQTTQEIVEGLIVTGIEVFVEGGDLDANDDGK